uniref:Ovule protein n=1 Tax=Mesocestoides corti TaxID=53468 RepID=A0A5K3G5K0_MESCO
GQHKSQVSGEADSNHRPKDFCSQLQSSALPTELSPDATSSHLLHTSLHLVRIIVSIAFPKRLHQCYLQYAPTSLRRRNHLSRGQQLCTIQPRDRRVGVCRVLCTSYPTGH